MKQKEINPLNVEQVSTIKERIENAKSLVLIDYKGINVADDTELRRRFRENNVDYFVCKNTFLKLAAHELGIKELDEHLLGPTSIAVSKDDEIAPVKVTAKFVDELESENDILEFKTAIVDEEVMDMDQIDQLAKLPSKDELLAKLVGGMEAPISGFVRGLNGILQKLVVAFNAIKDKKEK